MFPSKSNAITEHDTVTATSITWPSCSLSFLGVTMYIDMPYVSATDVTVNHMNSFLLKGHPLTSSSIALREATNAVVLTRIKNGYDFGWLYAITASPALCRICRELLSSCRFIPAWNAIVAISDATTIMASRFLDSQSPDMLDEEIMSLALNPPASRRLSPICTSFRSLRLCAKMSSAVSHCHPLGSPQSYCSLAHI